MSENFNGHPEAESQGSKETAEEKIARLIRENPDADPADLEVFFE